MTSWKISSLTDKVRRAFTEAADQYDILASLQREIGRELVHKVVKLPTVHRALDVGCGTGYLTGKLKFYFPDSDIVGLDFAEGMLSKAKENHENIAWYLADARQLPFKDQSFDLIVSNLAYQWVGDILKAFRENRRILTDQGVLAATLFGFHTCDEFFSSLEATGIKDEFNRLPQIEEVQNALIEAGFKAKVDYERIQIQFKDLWELLGWLKAIGANNLSRGAFLGPQALQDANAYCLKNYPYHDGIRITFEVIWIYAAK
jgi:malonyl-CoA O-methyltransferase